jgi:hypothetical protein
MKMIGAAIEDLPPKIRPLMESFGLSPFHVAPERKAELAGLLDKHDIKICLDPNAKDWLFAEFRMGKLIYVGVRTLERLWAYCYGYNAVTTELQKADGEFNSIQNHVEFEMGYNLLEWASQTQLAGIEGEWPAALPDPSLTKDLEHVEAANHIFLMTSGRLLLHELHLRRPSELT